MVERLLQRLFKRLAKQWQGSANVKVQHKIGPNTIIEADGQTVAEVFESLVRLEDVFHGHETCGACQKTNIAYQVSQYKDKDGNAKPNGGWIKWADSQD